MFALDGLLRGLNEKGDGFGDPHAAGSRFPRTRILLHLNLYIFYYVEYAQLQVKEDLGYMGLNKEKFVFPHSMILETGD